VDGALLAALLPVDRLVEPDRASGVLDQLAVRGTSEEGVAIAKLAGHWLSFGPPLMLAAVPAAALMKLPQDVFSGSSSAFSSARRAWPR
jgi:heme exporter protein B